MTVAQILIDRSEMDAGEFLRKYPDYPIDPFSIMEWLTKVAREEMKTKEPNK